ncbi:helix-turn-helix transcriptional regulator [Pelovirga terrestris]|uniref:Helix-turn-helix transcriptional regulator n=1 Tax=Pelovirga terrestris TaxID=2771352 RepID=A0A8J6QTE1_9BACT|nr:helix-turn-helix transcriptional regulator [Pelovirga terrestris]MBD1399215.1 helix-turn-helix transcriptional regulator [Pelovirga terrestris]
MMSLDQSSVAVDGTALRRIREEKRLTQLYVSKVVGVTTDTVSRWENNRYPTIRRENAIRLAEALEVELADIIKKDIQIQPVEKKQESRYFDKRFWLVIAVCLMVVFLAWFFISQRRVPFDAQLQARRLLPLHVAPGHELLVQLVISTEIPLKGMILKEEFPPGWQFISSDPEAASVDVATGVARWIFRNPQTLFTVYYRLAVPDDVPMDNVIAVSGELIANPEGQQFVLPVSADQRVSIRPFHWADTNANYVIDDMEILVFSELTENTSELDDEWYLVEQIWHSGSYRWDDDSYRFVPTSEEAPALIGPDIN